MDLNSILDTVKWEDIVSIATMKKILVGVIVFAVGYGILKFIMFLIHRFAQQKFTKQNAMVVEKISFYVFFSILCVIALQTVGLKLSPLLGAAGIVGIAVGFAAQTSVSNLISGFFLIGENPFSIGDQIKIGTTEGIVESIDTLSVKLRTYDNLYVRIPNESIIKSEVTNRTRYPIRRIDILIGVAYKEDIRNALDVLKEIADKSVYVMDEPEPYITFKQFGESSLDIHFGIWVESKNFIVAKREMMISVKEEFDKRSIDFPFPHRTLFGAGDDAPISIKLLKD